jgi:hypothetical protein
MRRAVLSSLAFVFLFAGCESANQNPFIVRVASINGGSPLLADVIGIDPENGPYIPTELPEIVMTNTPYWSGTTVDPSAGWYDFEVKGFTVHWERSDGGPTSGTGWSLADFDYTESVQVIVPFNGSVTFGTVLVPIGMKTTEPFASLALSGETIRLTARIDFVGSSTQNPDDELHVPVSLGVSFSNYVDE